VAREFLRQDALAGPAKRTASAAEQAAQEPGRRAAEQFATLGAAHAAGITATVNNQNKVEIHLPPGTSKDSELAKQVRTAVAEALKEGNRTALQQITQRGEK
jgi:carboxylesterase type B